MKSQIQKELRNGATIESICEKYELTFKELCKLFISGNYTNTKSFSSTGKLYISYSGERYIIRRNRKYYGAYSTLEDAVKVRDYLMINGWYRNRLNKICEELGVERCGRSNL